MCSFAGFFIKINQVSDALTSSINTIAICPATDLHSLLPSSLPPLPQIPVFIRWGQYLCSLKFAMNLAMITEFGDCPADQRAQCEALLEINDVKKDLWYVYVAILLGLFVAFRVTALVFLRGKAR